MAGRMDKLKAKFSRASLKRVARVIGLSLCIGVIIGYLSFHMTMPSVSVPQTTNPSLAVAGLVLFAMGLLVGMLSDNLESMTIEALLGIIIGIVVGWILFISPTVNPDIVIPNATGYIYNILHSSLPLIILAIVTLFIGGFMGGMVMENMQAKGGASVFDKIESMKKLE